MFSVGESCDRQAVRCKRGRTDRADAGQGREDLSGARCEQQGDVGLEDRDVLL